MNDKKMFEKVLYIKNRSSDEAKAELLKILKNVNVQKDKTKFQKMYAIYRNYMLQKSKL
jgi:hypothetical protein